jgi:S1-C subfamily serine protease
MQRPVVSFFVLQASSFNSPLTVSASELEKDLSPDERTVVQVVRQSGPSVAFVTSVLPVNTENNSRRQRGRRQPPPETKTSDSNRLPPGRSLGSGSGFIIDSAGYLLTNYHVIEAAYRLQRMATDYQGFVDHLTNNVTAWTGAPLAAVNSTLQNALGIPQQRLPSVYVRINSATDYQRCEIVDVQPALDVAVLKIIAPNNSTLLAKAFAFGSSSDLLVGQSLIAIGNPFGLDNTVTTGVVSALNREVRTTGRNGLVAQQPIRNCIQTDCAINPGNSGVSGSDDMRG